MEKELIQKFYDLIDAFDEKLNRHNEYYDQYFEGSEESAAAALIDDEDFIYGCLWNESMALIKAVLSTHWHGRYACGVGITGKTREEFQQKEKQRSDEFYENVNKSIADFVKKGAD